MSKLGSLNTTRRVSDQLSRALYNLKLTENFKAFDTTVTIPAATEKVIRNHFDDAVPTQFIIVNRTGNGIVVRGDSEWTLAFLSLKNVSSTSSATVTVVFLA